MYRASRPWHVPRPRLQGLVPEHVCSTAHAGITVAFAHVFQEIVIPVQRPVLLLQSVGAGANREFRIALGDPDPQTTVDGGLPNALLAGTGAKTHERACRDDNLAHVPAPDR
jgi:hypothetical protein